VDEWIAKWETHSSWRHKGTITLCCEAMGGSMSGSGPSHVMNYVIEQCYELCIEPCYVVLVVDGAMTMHWTMHEVPL
jgi:hypothetical protein